LRKIAAIKHGKYMKNTPCVAIEIPKRIPEIKPGL
jgi:hypothetical protein